VTLSKKFLRDGDYDGYVAVVAVSDGRVADWWEGGLLGRW